MLLKTIEFVPSDISLTVDSLQTQLNDGKYDDILAKFNFFTITEKGLTLVKQDKTIITNATVDLSAYSTSEDIDKKYVAKVEGYSLISDTEITRLSKIDNYDDTEIKKSISECALKTDIPNVSNFITEDTLNGYAKTSDLHSHSNLSILETITTEKIAQWDAAAGGSSIDLSDYAKKTDLESYATTEYVNTEIGKIQIPDVSKYLTSDDLVGYAKISDIPTNYLTAIPEEYVTDEELTAKGYLTEHQSLDEYAKTSDLPTFEFDTDGTLIVTINGVSNRYSPVVTA